MERMEKSHLCYHLTSCNNKTLRRIAAAKGQ